MEEKEEEEEEEEEKCTLLKHEWITKSRVHSFAPYRPRNPQKVYLSLLEQRWRVYSGAEETHLFALFTHPTPTGDSNWGVVKSLRL